MIKHAKGCTHDQDKCSLCKATPKLLEACIAISTNSKNPEYTMKNIRYIVKTLVDKAIKETERN